MSAAHPADASPVVAAVCPSCGRPAGAPVLDGLIDVENRVPGAYAISRCPGCRLMYLSTKPRVEALASLYDADYHVRADRAGNALLDALFRLRYQRRYRRIRRLLGRTPGSVLEVGCGDGRFLGYLRGELGDGCRLAGVELDPSTIRLPAGSRIRIHEKLESIPDEETFELILLYDVLEHLENPVASLGLLRRRLAPGGLVFLMVPNWDSLWRRVFPRHWGGLQVPRHQTFFDPGTLALAIDRAGLRLRTIARVYDPGDLSVAVCNWLTDRLGLRTLPRKAWFYYPVLLAGAPLVLLQNVVLRESGEIEAVAELAPSGGSFTAGCERRAGE